MGSEYRRPSISSTPSCGKLEEMHRLTLGDFELTVFSDGIYRLDGGNFFGVVPKILWSRKVQADENNYVPAGLNSLLIRTGKQTVLVETGMGNKLSERMVKIYGQPAQLLTNLSAAGVSPDDIDIVINSHLHFDHCGWNTVRDKNGKIVPTFPRAKYYAPEGEWQYARKPSERDAISYIPDNYDPLVKSGQMTLLKGGEEIVPGISVRTYPGHTASMQGVIVNGRPGFERARLEAAPSDAAKESEALAPEGSGSSAAERRKNAAHGASGGSAAGERQAPEGRKNPDVGEIGKGTALAALSEESTAPKRRKNAAHGASRGLPAEREQAPEGRKKSSDKGTTACYISDLIPTTAHIDLTWGMAFDLYPLQTIESKKLYYAQSIPEKWLTIFTHDPKTPWAYVEKDEFGKMVTNAVTP